VTGDLNAWLNGNYQITIEMVWVYNIPASFHLPSAFCLHEPPEVSDVRRSWFLLSRLHTYTSRSQRASLGFVKAYNTTHMAFNSVEVDIPH
jgi:hypothetical protein